MTDIKIDFHVKKTNATWHVVPREKIKPKFRYERGNPEGWTDDLGIIADYHKNHWVEQRDEGWYSDFDPQDNFAIREWCEQNFKHGDWYTGGYYIFLRNEKDVAWFMLRWS